MLARTTWLRWGSPKSSRTGSCAHSKAVLLVMPLPPPQQPGAAGAGAAGAGAAGAGAGTKATAGAVAGAGGGGGAVFEVPPNGFEPRLIFFRIALRIAQK